MGKRKTRGSQKEPKIEKLDEDYSKLCRLCLEKPEGKPSYLTSDNIKKQIAATLVDIEIKEDPNLSKIICKKCCETLRDFGSYKDSVRKNQELILSGCVKVEEIVAVDIVIKEENECENFELECDEKPVVKQTNVPVKSEDEEEEVSEQGDPSYCPDDSEGEMSDKNEETYKMIGRNDLLPLPEIEIENGTNKVWCPVCFNKYNTKICLIRHGRVHHPEYNWGFNKNKLSKYPCKYCKANFKSNNKLDLHVFTEHLGHEPFQCDLCGYKTNLRKYMTNHMWRKHMKHKKIGSFLCKMCGDISGTKERLKKHQGYAHVASEDKPFKCLPCNLHYKSHSYLLKHNRERHSSELFPFSCALCISAKFESKDILEVHMKLHVVDEEYKKLKPLPCNLCERRFTKESVLKSHIELHETNHLISCQICGRTIVFEQRVYHMKLHELKYEDYEHVCEICARRFLHPSSLRVHLKRHQQKKEAIKCEPCGKVFKTQGRYKMHITVCAKINHGWQCKYCPARLSSCSGRWKHTMKFHTGYNCVRCNISFERLQELKNHTQTEEHKILGEQKRLESIEARIKAQKEQEQKQKYRSKKYA